MLDRQSDLQGEFGLHEVETPDIYHCLITQASIVYDVSHCFLLRAPEPLGLRR